MYPNSRIEYKPINNPFHNFDIVPTSPRGRRSSLVKEHFDDKNAIETMKNLINFIEEDNNII